MSQPINFNALVAKYDGARVLILFCWQDGATIPDDLKLPLTVENGEVTPSAIAKGRKVLKPRNLITLDPWAARWWIDDRGVEDG